MLTFDGKEEEETIMESSELERPSEVCLNSVMGLTKPKTQDAWFVAKHEVVVTIDPRAAHNFISLNTVEKLKIPVTATCGFGVALGNGVTV